MRHEAAARAARPTSFCLAAETRVGDFIDILLPSTRWLATGAVLEAFVFPFNAERAFRHFKRMMPSDMLMPLLSRIGIDAALAVLQKMDMAPSDAEIDEAGKKIEAQTRKADNNRSGR